MSEKHKRDINRIFMREKIKTLIYPIFFGNFLYGLQLSLFPSILSNYQAYNLIDEFVTHWQIGAVFIMLSFMILASFKIDHRLLLVFSSIVSFAIWMTFSFAFLISPPPNTIWIFSALMAFMCFYLTRRV